MCDRERERERERGYMAILFSSQAPCHNFLFLWQQELARLQSWIDDDPRLYTAEILHSLLLTYRDIQAYGLMIDLVEKLPTHEQVSVN